MYTATLSVDASASSAVALPGSHWTTHKPSVRPTVASKCTTVHVYQESELTQWDVSVDDQQDECRLAAFVLFFSSVVFTRRHYTV